MIKRIVWFVSGLVTGITAMVFTGRRVRRRVEKVTNIAPIKAVREATQTVRQSVAEVGEAVRDGRDAMRAKENELWARAEGRASRLDQELETDDEVLVDGEPIEPGRVVVLRQIDPGFVSEVSAVSDVSADRPRRTSTRRPRR
jgi:hypothetical protein